MLGLVAKLVSGFRVGIWFLFGLLCGDWLGDITGSGWFARVSVCLWLCNMVCCCVGVAD